MNTKHRKLFLTVNAVLASLASSAYAATIPDLNVDPLINENKQITPAMVIAVSVEFPTSYIAYSESNLFTPEHAKHKYLGYFDSDKCYKYVVTVANGDSRGFEDYLHSDQEGRAGWRKFVGDGYFQESSTATSSDKGYIG
ncbi:MAG: hypothetical protein IJ566_03085 [Cardiobacteriaceae bacterium]|nr:hypothetical protein [Cardiobacteriaceae bacterium]